MRTMIEGLRTRILESAKLNSPNPIDKDDYAKHPGYRFPVDDPNNDMRTWESYLWRRKDVFIVLSFNQRNLNAECNLQSITLQGHHFPAIRLFIYDFDSAPANVRITPQDLVDKLSNKLSLQNNKTPYCIELSDGRATFGATQLGHVLDLYIRNTNRPWNIPSVDQIGNTATDLVDKVVATWKALLPVAEYYANNREAILARRI